MVKNLYYKFTYLKVEKPTGQLIAISNIITTPIDTILNHFRRIQHVSNLK